MNKMVRKIIPSLISVFFLVLLMDAAGSGVVGYASGKPLNQSVQSGELLRTGNGFINGEAEGHMNSLIGLLQETGLDISYGKDGETVFSMVDQSLTKVITDLSLGNTSGFFDVPLIQETWKYLGIKPGEIMIQPGDIRGQTRGSDRYY
jgi:hypothetical protein